MAPREGARATPLKAKIIPVLGSVLDRKVVASTIAKFGVEVIYHAAAYKHACRSWR